MMSRKPKFKLELSINELSNIPQVSGNCYVELQIHDSKKPKPWSLGLSKLSLKNDSDDSSNDSKSALMKNANVSGSSGNLAVTTSSKKIHNFKCSFNYRLSCNIKFGVRKRENLIDNKYLTARVFYVNDKAKEHSVHNSHKLRLGKLEINLAEYLNFSEPITSKYLLKESKVNSILSVTVHLVELPSDFSFRTQLQISDKQTSDALSSADHRATKSSSLSGSKTGTNYKVPEFDRKNIFGGLNDVLGADSKPKDKAAGSPQTRSVSSTRNSPASSEASSEKSKKHRKKGHQRTPSGNTQASAPAPAVEDGFQPNVDPIVNTLYKKILESTWDPNLHNLLDFSPEVCISHIFDDDADKWRKKLQDELEHDDEDYEVRCVHGLVNEVNYREDLRSWTIHPVS